MLTKVCTKCNVEKIIDAYSNSKTGKFGKCSACKSCFAQYEKNNRETIRNRKRANYENNKESMIEIALIYYNKNKDLILQKKLIYRNKNKESIKQKKYKYKKDNPHIFSAQRARRRARTDNIILTEFDEIVLIEATDLRAKRSEITKTPWHIDHIIPLNHKNASGLHNGYNLQVVPGDWNIKKGNKNMNTYFNID